MTDPSRDPRAANGDPDDHGTAPVGLFHVPSLAQVRRDHPRVRVVSAADTKRDALQACYRAVDAPAYAAANLDALADILGDLSWLPDGPVELAWLGLPRLPESVRSALVAVLVEAVTQSVGSRHRLTVYLVDAAR